MEHLDAQLKKIKFEQFFLITFPKVKAFAWKMLGSEDDAEDVSQDVFVKLWNCPEIWEDQETWNGYIYAMVRNAIYDFLKHKSIVLQYQEQTVLNEKSLIEPDFQSQLYAEEIELLVELALDNMPEQRRKIFIMSRKQGMTNQEIADKLNISVRTVEHHIYLALQNLKKIILILFFSYFC